MNDVLTCTIIGLPMIVQINVNLFNWTNLKNAQRKMMRKKFLIDESISDFYNKSEIKVIEKVVNTFDGHKNVHYGKYSIEIDFEKGIDIRDYVNKLSSALRMCGIKVGGVRALSNNTLVIEYGNKELMAPPVNMDTTK